MSINSQSTLSFFVSVCFCDKKGPFGRRFVFGNQWLQLTKSVLFLVYDILNFRHFFGLSGTRLTSLNLGTLKTFRSCLRSKSLRLSFEFTNYETTFRRRLNLLILIIWFFFISTLSFDFSSLLNLKAPLFS